MIELAAFGAMLLLPDIDLTFRFIGLLFILLLRLAFAGIRYLAGRKSEKKDGAMQVKTGGRDAPVRDDTDLLRKLMNDIKDD